MPVKTRLSAEWGVFFLTFTCFNWISLIDITASYDLVYKWFDHLRNKRHYLIGYVIMPNHIHCIIGFRNSDKNINTMIGNGKRFIAYQIVARLKKQKSIGLLGKMASAVNRSDKKQNKLHEVWEDSFDWKECYSDKMIIQKLDYIHDNPCRGKWRLAESPVDYIHSSARYYITCEQGIYPVTNFMELEDTDLSER
jgi:REP element-mobilizing transposase RayT